MNHQRIGWLLRTLRVRHGLTQAELARRGGVGRWDVSRLEHGQAGSFRLDTLEALASVLGARLDLRVLWNGPELDRLLDEGHAALAAHVKRRLERWGWVVRVEASYSRYGERGRIDLLAFHPRAAVLLVVELKTELVDVQALLGSLDVKARLAPGIAERFGWTVKRVVPAIVFSEDRTTRNRLARVAALFDRYALRGRAATAWLARPDAAASGLLWITAVDGRRQPPPRYRVRRRRPP